MSWNLLGVGLLVLDCLADFGSEWHSLERVADSIGISICG